MTRHESTATCTALVEAWLRVSRGAQAISREVGYDPGFGLGHECRYRADVVGMRFNGELASVDLVEVKGSLADWTQDRLNPKWGWRSLHVARWIAGPAEVVAAARVAVPCAGLLETDPDARKVTVRRRPVVHTPMFDRYTATFNHLAWALARCQTSRTIPTDRRYGSRPYKIARMAEGILGGGR